MDDRLLELHNVEWSLSRCLVNVMCHFPQIHQLLHKVMTLCQNLHKRSKSLSNVLRELRRIIQECKKCPLNILVQPLLKQKRVQFTQFQDLSRELEQIMIQNQHYSQQLKESLAAIKQDVETAQATYPDEPETQMKINQRNELLSKVQDVLNASSQISIKYQTCVREKLRRQTKILDENLSEKQLDEICNDPQQAQQLLQEKLYGQAPSLQLQNAVSDIQDKYKDIQKLEQVSVMYQFQSVQLVYQLFVDLAILVETQGQQLDNIEMTLGSAKTYVNKGTVKLSEAKEDHQAAKKKICCIILIGVVILAVIIAPIVATT